MRFLLDTGCYDIHLTPVEVFFMEHQGIFNSKTAIGIEKRIYADGKEHECPTYILNSVELGGIKIDSVKCIQTMYLQYQDIQVNSFLYNSCLYKTYRSYKQSHKLHS